MIQLTDDAGSLLLALCLMKGKVLTIVERRFALVDKTGIVGDQAVLCLTEDLIQHRDWHNAGADQLVKYITGAHTL